MKNDRLSFNSIITLSSPRENEPSASTSLQSTIFPALKKKFPNLVTKIYCIKNEVDYRSAIIDIVSLTNNDKIRPIIHLDMHGNKEGLSLGNHDFIPWYDFHKHCTIINILTKFNLLVVLTTCEGGYFTRYISPVEIAPCWGIIGTIAPILIGETYNVFDFFTMLVSSENLKQALEAFNEGIPEERRFLFYSALTLFKHAVRHYTNIGLTESEISKRACEIMQQARKFDLETYERVKTGILNTKFHIEGFIKRFFMHDIVPENRTRYNFTYEDIMTENIPLLSRNDS